MIAICLPGLGSADRTTAPIERLEKTIKELSPFTCDFTQTYRDRFQDKTAISRGTFSFMQPGLMRWEYRSPEEMLFIVGREKAWLYDPILENVTIQELDQVSGIKTMRFLSRDESIGNHFHPYTPQSILLEDVEGGEAIYLKPNNKNQSLAELQIVFDAEKQQILQFVIVDHNQNYRRITLSNIREDPTLSASDFSFEVTSTMEVIEGFTN